MSLLIDGYNLLHATGISGRGAGPGGLQRSRLALLNFLAESIDPQELPRTIVVFDAHDATVGLPRTVVHRGLTVRFASQYESADELIEELIRVESAPRRLVVVSSDHRIQRAARRRRAKAVDSDVWRDALVRQRQQRLARQTMDESAARPPVPLLEEDVRYWLRQFGGESALAEWMAREIDQPSEALPSRPVEKKPSKQRRKSRDSSGDKPIPNSSDSLDNPFPPGYGDDLLEKF
ncbi:MAG: NYN domain-containing protein [Thermoguttaceae bacterium]